MYTHFSFADGSNPYIATTNKGLFGMICKYILTQTAGESFIVDGPAAFWTVHTGKKISEYKKKQTALQEFAIDWQRNFDRFSYSWAELDNWQQFFEEYGKKYGLLREFRENAIC